MLVLDLCGQSASQGPYSSGRQQSLPSYPLASVWGGTSHSSGSDGQSSTSVAFLLSSTSEYLATTDYGFNIPYNAIITGVEVEIEKWAFGALQSVKDYEVRLVHNGVKTGLNKAKSTVWPFTNQTFKYGSTTDMWGISLSPTSINASDFGVVVSAYLYGLIALPIAYIDDVRITVHYSESPLPVELLSFEGKRLNENQVRLDWQTQSEVANDYFLVEYSEDMMTWETKETVAGAGYSALIQNYSSFINDNSASISYYRLSQCDFDGTIEYFQPVAVEPSLSASELVFYPNPISSGTLKYRSNQAITSIRIFDLMGNELISYHLDSSSAMALGELEIKEIESGHYFVEAITKSQERLFRTLFIE